MILKLFRILKTRIFLKIEWIISKCSDKLFLFLGNTYNFMRRNNVVYRSTKNGLYSASDANTKIYFSNKSQALHAYSSGLTKRLHDLSRVYFLNEIEFKDGDLILDCGANVGDIHCYLKTFEKAAIRYIGFEPSPPEFKALSENAGSDNSRNVGLWNKSGTLRFYLSSDGADSSLIEPPVFSQVIDVKTVRLDEMIDEPIKLLKLEAEGAEPEVLLGALGALSSIEYISADLSMERGKFQESTIIPVVNFLLENGFIIQNIRFDRLVVLFKNGNYK